MLLPRTRLRALVAVVVVLVVGAGLAACSTENASAPDRRAPSLTQVPTPSLVGEEQIPGEPTDPPDPDERAYADPSGPTGNGRPNVVLITTDDMTASDLAYMPVTRRLLAREGVSFERALSPHPLCCPARGAILTGQYAQNNYVKSNQSPYNYEALQSSTALPVWLRRAGYQTAFTGKYLNGFGTDGPRQEGWDYWDPTMVGQYAYTPFTMENNGDPRRYTQQNNVDYVNQRVTSLIDRFERRPQPWFIWASHVAPHGRLDEANGIPSTAVALPPKRYARKFPTEQSPSLRDPGFHQGDLSDKNSLVQQMNRPSRTKINEVFRSRIRSLQAVDDGVADLVAKLRAKGILDETYLMFTSDNGFLMGEHNLVTKNLPYRQALRVPLLVRGPGVPADTERLQRALMIDLAPTIAEIANADPLVPVDGVSLLPAVRTDDALRSTVLIQAGPAKQVEDAGYGWWWRGVTTARYTYAHFYADGIEELYDHTYDPSETYNLATDPGYADVLLELRRRTDVLGGCSGPQECSQEFDPLPEPVGGPPVIPDPALPRP